MKKLILTTAAMALLSAGIMAQGSLKTIKPVKKNINPAQQVAGKQSGAPIPNRGCGTPVPTQQWDAAFNEMVENHKQDLMTGRTATTTYTIPIIFHVIHEGEAIGVGHNISNAQIQSQIAILNADYNGTGYNTSVYATLTNSVTGKPAFYEYAANTTGTNSVSAASKASNGSIAIGNAGIYFCLATKNPSGTTLAVAGIDRMSYTAIPGATKPSTSANVQTLMDGTIKPATIWDPTKYFNVWLSDGGTSGLLGYATFPPAAVSGSAAVSSSQNGGSTNGAFGMTVSSQSTTDGVWVVYNAIGNTGNVSSPYQYGRSLTHESGHWLGLRHIWGDGTCANDFCNDTPPAASANINTVSFPNPKYPFHAGTCTSAPSNSPDGEMYMNFMDYSGDAELWMFTTDQVNRFHAALASSPYRSGLTASAANLCAGVTQTYTTIVGAFTYPTSICTNAAASFVDASTGGPVVSWAWSVNPSTGVTINTATSQNPAITFPTAGTYTVTMVATNTVNASSVSHAVTVSSCTAAAGSCDTISNVNPADTITLYSASTGYVSGSGLLTASTGTVTYTIKTIGEVYNQSIYPTNVTQVKGAMLIFYRESTPNIGTKGTSVLTLKMTNTGTDGAGAIVPGTTAAATQTVSLTSVVASANTAGPDYMGNQLYDYTGYMKAYPVMFTTPVTMTSTFGLTLTLPTVSGDTAVVWSNDEYTSNTSGLGTGCIQLKPSNSTTTTWYNVESAIGIPISFGIIPIACTTTTTGIESNHLGSSITLFPNPNSGQFNFAVTLPEATNLNFTIVDMLGQTVYTRAENNVTNTILNVDLSNLAKGIYYANIVDSNNNKTVKKIIIQ
ncbi:MAG: T9SS type A sorting domain-containing protein [Bacteroidia bacterium]